MSPRPRLTDTVRTQMLAQVGRDWDHQARCAGAGDDTWFPDSVGQAWIPLAVCAVCPVTRACLAYALATGVHGIWGGTDENDRKRMITELSRGMTVTAVLDAATSTDSTRAA